MTKKNNHPDFIITEIDKELRPLIRELNKVGIKTTTSCNGHGGNAYIGIDMISLVEIRIIKKDSNKIWLVIEWKPK